ncbi:hypothetical protein SOQ14_12050 [Erythrobacter sp. T5W1-R]|uniref:hypothetical protein n=1 Tax=Erythrobacter sp. T5W1-R TaxID=3101752 RepID=UPI002B001F03|nr:hypothetical protein [Erythrobacter sp. T5W1-R]MEA1619650.1 hypothetical protein [Erythrobacter sp. T5W1-R]
MMDAKNPRTGQGARASKSTAADKSPSTPNHPENQPRRLWAVIVRRDVWGKIVVAIDPPSISHQPRTFRSHDEAVKHARDLAKLHDALFIDMVMEGDE